jgi:hypothetical protein
MNRIGKKRRKVSANLTQSFHSQKNSAVISTGVAFEFSPVHRGGIQHSHARQMTITAKRVKTWKAPKDRAFWGRGVPEMYRRRLL